MFGNLFSIFDLPLVCILIVLSLFGLLFVKNTYNIFISLFTGIFFLIFIACTMLTQQIYLGEFLVIGIFFIFAIIFFIFNLSKDYDESHMTDTKKNRLKNFFTALMFVSAFVIIGLNFHKINNSETKFLNREVVMKENAPRPLSMRDEQSHDSYVENISLLNQNKIFQKLTHIVMFYVGMVVVLYFFNRRGENEG